MSIKIRLDIPALQTLFPPGSEAELELTKAACAHLVRGVTQKLIENSARQLNQEVRDEITKVAIEVFNEQFKPNVDYFSAEKKLNEYHVRLLRDAFTDEIQRLREETIKPFTNNISTTIDARIKTAVQNRLADVTDQYVFDEVRKKMNAALKGIESLNPNK